MSNTPHELSAEFPEFIEKMSSLKVADKHFARLAEDYHALNRKVHAAETNVQPREELAEMDLRKRRGALKDEIYAYLKAN
ncbi:MAG: YdcH family protein [Shimia sp.]|uniref:YdcH family protein n=1 Tax=Shimia sp. TaxID=1954381 RepID=UPI0040594F3A